METSSSSSLNHSEITPEKLAMMKLEAQQEMDRDSFSELASPISRRKLNRGFSYSSNNGDASSGSMARSSSRHVTRSSRRSSGFMASHRNKMSMELTAKAEGKFFALMDLMATASREASSMKEIWAQMLSEREAFAKEREELMDQVTEVTQELEVRDSEQHRHAHEGGDRKRQVDKLLLELSATLETLSVEKKKVAEQDNELDRARRELVDVRESSTRYRGHHERIRNELESLQLTLKSAEADRDSARGEADRHHRDLQRVTRERSDLTSKLTDITSKHETSRKEVLNVNDRIKMYDLERDEQLHEAEKLKEDVRRIKLRAEEADREVLEMTEKHEKLTREANKLRETIRTIDAEKDDYKHTIDQLRREVKTVIASRDEVDERYSEMNLRYEHIKREVLTLKERLREVEVERDAHIESVEKTKESHRLLVIERDELKDEVAIRLRKAEDARRQVVVLTESLRKSESTLTEVRSEVHTLSERAKNLDFELTSSRNKHGQTTTELTDLRAKIVIFQAEIRNLTESRDRLHEELKQSREEYEEITETMTTYNDESKEFEFEIDSLRTLLRETREQKELAISARQDADRERDEYMSKYEEKCRELERFEESSAAHFHAHSGGSGGVKTSSRVVSRASTTLRNSTNHREIGSTAHDDIDETNEADNINDADNTNDANDNTENSG